MREGKRIMRSKPTKEQVYLKTNLGHFMSLNIVKRIQLTPPNDGKVYTVTNQNNATPIVKHVLTINQYPRCSCPNYWEMHSGCIGDKDKYILCKHLYHLFWLYSEKIHTVIFASIVLHRVKKNL